MRQPSDFEIYETSQGDTWDSIAYDFFGDEFYSSDLILWNEEYASTLIFENNEIILIPVYDKEESASTQAPWR